MTYHRKCTEEYLLDCIAKGNITALIRALAYPPNYLAVHEALAQSPVLLQYYIAKAWRSANHTTYLSFAATAVNSRFGCKYVFHNILKQLYAENVPGSLRYDIVLPEVATYIQLFKTYYTPYK